MNINIYEEKFLPVKDIVMLKSYLKRLSDYKVLNESLLGSIFIDLSYFDSNMQENFKTLELEFAVILKDSIKIEAITLNEVSCELVDLKGINVTYNLEIDYTEIVNEQEKENEEKVNIIEEVKSKDDVQGLKEDGPNLNVLEEKERKNPLLEPKKVESVIAEVVDDGILELPIDEVTYLEDFNTYNEKDDAYSLKENIKNEYDTELKENLKFRTSIIRTKNEDEDSFLNIFNKFSSRYLSIKKILITSDKVDDFLTENKIDIKHRSEFYDEEKGVLTLKTYE